MSKRGLYIGKCLLFSNDYSGDALTISKQGSSLSTTHTQMSLIPCEQLQLIQWFCRNNRELVEQSLENCDENAKL